MCRPYVAYPSVSPPHGREVQMSAEPTPSVEGGDGCTAHRPSSARPGLYDGRGWRTSSWSNQQDGKCVEAGPSPRGGVLMRDSRNRGEAPLRFGEGEWTRLIAWAVRAGDGPAAA